MRQKEKYLNSLDQIVIINHYEFYLAATAALAASGGSGVGTLSSMMYGSMAMNIVM